MADVARIVLGLEEHDVAEEVMHFLDRSGRARVIATAEDERQLSEAVRQLEPDAVVASPRLLRNGGWDGARLLAVDTRESVAALRTALKVGASGFYLWPVDRDELAGAAARVDRVSSVASEQRARVIAVLGSRGGAGATFVSTHLSAAFARKGRDCVLVDMDAVYADATAALGVPDEADVRTVADVLPLVDELTIEHLDEVLWRHADGFRALLAPGIDDADRVRAADYEAAISTLSTSVDVLVLQVPRVLDEVASGGLRAADRVLLVLTLDVLSFRDAKRALARLDSLGLTERVGLVVNRASRAEITPRDVARVFGREPVAVLPADAAVPGAQDHGRLLPGRGRTARALARLAAGLEEDG